MSKETVTKPSRYKLHLTEGECTSRMIGDEYKVHYTMISTALTHYPDAPKPIRTVGRTRIYSWKLITKWEQFLDPNPEKARELLTLKFRASQQLRHRKKDSRDSIRTEVFNSNAAKHFLSQPWIKRK